MKTYVYQCYGDQLVWWFRLNKTYFKSNLKFPLYIHKTQIYAAFQYAQGVNTKWRHETCFTYEPST